MTSSGIIARLCAGLLCLAATASAVDWKALKPQGYVSDFAGAIDAQSKAQIEDYAARVEQATGAQMALVTVGSLEGEPIEDVANDIFHAWGVGKKTQDNGVMVLLAVADRKSRMEVGGGLGAAIPDSMAGLLLDDMRPALREQQYGQAMLAAAVRLGTTIAQSKNVTVAAPQPVQREDRRQVQRSTRDSIPWQFILIAIFILLSVLRRGGGGRYGGGGGGGFWSGMLLGGLLNSGRGGGGGRDGGGFGGFDSGGGGGGFGGFGGGDSGGGGASSDW